jgi:hypothetical protein
MARSVAYTNTVAGPATGFFSVAVTNEVGGATVGGGVFELWDATATNLLASSALSGSGTLTAPLAAGPYTWRYQPPLGFGIGSAVTDFASFNITAGQTTPVAVTALADDGHSNFQSFDTVPHFLGFCEWNGTTGDPSNSVVPIPSTAMFYGWNGGGNTVFGSASSGPGNPPAVNYQSLPLAGPTGEQVWRITQPGRPSSGVSDNLQVGMAAILNPPHAAYTDKFYVRQMFKLSSGWKPGGGLSSNIGSSCEYKFTFIAVQSTSHGGQGTIEIMFENGSSGQPISGSYPLRIVINDGFSGTTDHQLPSLGPNFDGAWHVLVLEFLNINTSAITVNAYVDGVQHGTSTTGPFFPNGTWNVTVQPQFRLNINNGPTVDQTIDTAEISIGRTRPSLLNGYAV